MKVFVIGGTRFIGLASVRRLLARGHEVMLLHRGKSPLPEGLPVREILGDRAQIASHAMEIQNFRPDAMLDLFAFKQADTDSALTVMASFVPHAVAISSGDAYRAFGRLLKTEPGPPDPVPLNEDSPVREQPITERGITHHKPAMERAYLDHPQVVSTILRLPAVYGPGDGQRRFGDLVMPMHRQDPLVRIQEDAANWRWTREYIDNVAEAITLAVEAKPAKGRIYNVGEQTPLSELEWANLVSAMMDYKGEIALTPASELGEEAFDGDFRQDIVMDSTRLRDELGWRPTVTLEDGLRKTIDWLIDSGSDSAV